jgi:hypothetical protein|tara:strand:+ start:187 stop:423 length:237 start_codon:yes stop_codon:yes gene_type:complete
MRWAQLTIESRGLKGLRLRSCRLWLDEKGFHPFLDQDELLRPDMQKSMCCAYKDLPEEAWCLMDKYDREKARGSEYAT